MSVDRRRLFLLCTAFAAAAAGPALGQDYPNRPITIVVPAAAGSFTDDAARIVGQRLAERLRKPVVIDNRPGANTVIGVEYLIKQKPDGYTLMFTASTVHAANPSLLKKLSYHPLRDFTPIARVGQVPFIVAVTNSIPAKN
ncbi:MAG: tripartite tricarboxylate transporter substrate binding protein, partial [Alcaligenaceae bacterium]